MMAHIDFANDLIEAILDHGMEAPEVMEVVRRIDLEVDQPGMVALHIAVLLTDSDLGPATIRAVVHVQANLMRRAMEKEMQQP